MKEFKGLEVPGPGEVPYPAEILSELSLGLNIQVLEGKMTSSEAQEYFSMKRRELIFFAVNNPGCLWEMGSTQVRELERRRKKLLAARKNNAK